MTISIANDHGTITISDQVFAGAILKVLGKIEYNNKVWPSNDKSKLMGQIHEVEAAEFADEISTELLDDGSILISFHIITQLGASISAVTESLSKDIFELFEKEKYPVGEIHIHISGVKSKNIANRDLEVVYSYEPKR